ncbi:helix-turn-helix domain-containing protein [Paracoccus sphaerophysae]|uniref:helix-turn-helix domain-containing protein n=1 Tax=Paracoccus sphaerophysae TaxID=690417 RepID=UPI0006914052|nr:helix-turn-helix domain-containing protein [Paracoccus sphaerophysae]
MSDILPADLRESHSFTSLAKAAELAPMTVRTVLEGGGTIASLDKLRRVLKLSWSWSSAETPTGIGRDLARRRKGKGMSQRDMAVRLGVTHQTIVTMETTFRGRVETLQRYLRVLGIHDLLRGPGQSRPLVPGANEAAADRVFTPRDLAGRIVRRFDRHLQGSILDPARGEGAFFDHFPAHLDRHWCELDEGRDFLAWTREVDWIMTNPPFSRLRDFLSHSLQVSRNVVFLMPLSHLTTSHRIAKIRSAGFGVRVILLVPRPASWPNSGFQFAAIWLQKGWSGPARFEDLG